jgi:hypothetical protein
MRKILTPEEIHKKESRRNRIISMVLLLIMLGSTIGFAFLYKGEDSTKSNSKVVNYGNQWVAQIGDAQFVFSSSPDEMNSTSIILLSSVGQFSGKPLYIDSQNSAFYNEIYSTLGRYAQRVQGACYDSCENSTLPEKTCSDNLIVIKESQKNKVYQNQSCIFIEGDMRAVDSFLYRTLDLA